MIMTIEYIGIILILLLILLIIYIIYTNNNKNNFMNKFNTTQIIYLSKFDTINFINNDEDNYIKSLSIYDLNARNVKNSNEYIYKITNACLDFNDNQKQKLTNCAVIAKNFFDNNYIWKFALIDSIYEEGFPHTRKDIIFLSPKIIDYTDDILIEILIHESIHIYQRYNKTAINSYLLTNGYKISRNRNTEPLIRANPDLDEYIYTDKNNEEMIYKYKSINPININDIIPSKNEHPYEVMAYEISEKYNKLKMLKYVNI
jgi:hypothetical protein